MAHLELNDIVYFLPDGRQLLNGVGFRVGDGAKTALIGPNGTGKTTLTRIIAGAAGGRRITVPPAGTRPTSDRVR